VLNLRDRNFGYYARDGKITGKKRIETEATIRGGNIVYTLNARVEPVNLPRPERPATTQGQQGNGTGPR
jgi:dihydroorotase